MKASTAASLPPPHVETVVALGSSKDTVVGSGGQSASKHARIDEGNGRLLRQAPKWRVLSLSRGEKDLHKRLDAEIATCSNKDQRLEKMKERFQELR
ncbi:uncharacterized protein G2W53_040999 [Senna tora]|uniref:Uncharacterized protein n=1 Tax=Senna tora TaxID=362788 RepID=A0A834VXM7_9FABA|nr:uncharacterized protein G2W53_040999 [Senna tora]